MVLAISSQQVQFAGVFLVAMVLSIAVHEFMHAFAASRLGDPTPESEDRLTLNPISHADPIGTIALPLIAAFSAMPLFGWGRPVPTQPSYYTRKISMRSGLAIVALAGPLGNLLLGLLVIVLVFLLSTLGVLTEELAMPLRVFLHLNLVLMVFNLLPIHPLDGGKIVASLLPARLDYIDDALQQYGMYVLIALLVLGGDLLGAAFQPFYDAANWLWTLAGGPP